MANPASGSRSRMSRRNLGPMGGWHRRRVFPAGHRRGAGPSGRRCPVINGPERPLPPLPALGDAQTLRRTFRRVEKGAKSPSFGDGNKRSASLIADPALRLGADFAIGCPEATRPIPISSRRPRAGRRLRALPLVITHDTAQALAGAHAVYTDVWTAWAGTELVKRKKSFPAFQVTTSCSRRRGPKPYSCHWPPAKRGEEVTDFHMEHPPLPPFSIRRKPAARRRRRCC